MFDLAFLGHLCNFKVSNGFDLNDLVRPSSCQGFIDSLTYVDIIIKATTIQYLRVAAEVLIGSPDIYWVTPFNV